ncbi:MAG: tetratricopeptide repeat protein [Verrucomicrobiota bacterium]
MKRFIVIFLSVLTMAGAAELSDADKRAITEANKFVQRGNDAVNNNSLTRARAEYQKALKIFPAHVDALYNLAVVCEKLKQNDEAIELYNRYLAIRPNDADVWTQLGVRYDDADKKADALAAYEKALAIDPKFGRAHNNLGVLLKEQGKLDDAQKHFETFLQLEEAAGRQNGDAYYSLGSLLLWRGRVKDAKHLLQKALDTDPSISYYNNAMGDVYLAGGETEMALAAYKKALEKDPKYAPAYSGMGDAFRQAGNIDKAAAAYAKALELGKDYWLVYYKTGLLWEKTQPAEAIKSFEKYLASDKTPVFQNEAKAKIEHLKQAKTNVTTP